MSNNLDPTVFQRKLAARRAEIAAKAEKEQLEREEFSDAVPEIPYEHTENDDALDRAISRIGIVPTYVKYIGKMRPVVRPGQEEGIKISCPIPGHTDANPSAWINAKKKTWFCGVCEIGGDVMDLAAIGKGLAWPNTYKTDGSFRQLRTDFATDFGFVPVEMPGGVTIVYEPEQIESSESDTNSDDPDKVGHETDSDKPPKTEVLPEVTDNTSKTGKKQQVEMPDDSEDNVAVLYEDEERDTYGEIPELNWEKILAEDTFLQVYMKQTCQDDTPEEYHFFHALVALSMAMGRKLYIADKLPVYGNLFICSLGRSGSGKSSAKYMVDEVIYKALPFNPSDYYPTGTKIIQAPGSAEVLVKKFQFEQNLDPSDPKKTVLVPVRGLIHFNELSSLVARTSRVGSALKPTLMQFYDMERVVSTTSLTTGDKEAHMPFASCITSTQPGALKDLLSRVDDASGFLNRWIFVVGTPKKPFAIYTLRVDLEPAVEKLEKIYAWTSSLSGKDTVTWSEEARNRFTDFFDSVITLDKKLSSNDMIVRVDLLMKKLILLFTANLMQKEIPLEAVNSAIELYPYLLSGYNASSKAIRKTYRNEEVADALLSFLKQNKDHSKPPTISQFLTQYKKRGFSVEMVTRQMEALKKAGLVDVIPSPSGVRGRPTVRYRYVGDD